jgi:ABC-type phosphate transport system ATPase subunit
MSKFVKVVVDGQDVFRLNDVLALRRRVGMVFPLPVGLPFSIYDNVAYAPRVVAFTIARSWTRSSKTLCVKRRSGMR